jgi:16S rRNA (guanine527-N7)-methyltransferase
MEKEIINSFSKFSSLNVSRETLFDLESFTSMILEKNREINLISKKTEQKNTFFERHLLDSAQIIDFVDLKSNTTTDLGSGSGMPGIVIAIILKNLKKNTKIYLYEKSHHKSHFLKDVSKKLKLKTEIVQKDVFEIKNLQTGTIMSRAFKPMPVVLDLVYENFSSYKNLIFFMGKNGKKILEKTLKDWDLEYTEKKSLTNEDSFLLNIKKMTKKF